ncbi:MAG: hypothetical protein AMXMBFR33_63450 [Candidatus Xenobia bacterium]
MDLERQLEQLTRDLQSLQEEQRRDREELTRALQAQSEFLASTTHELRSPLHTVLGMSEALLEETLGPLNESQRSSLETIYQSGRHLLGLIDDLLDLSRLEAGKLRLECRHLNVADLCRGTLDLVDSGSVTLDVEESLEVWADEGRLKQILVNLLSNALKASGAAHLTVAHDREREAVRFTVSDQGPGIAREDFSRLFVPFGQLDQSQPGTGLGLMMVQRLAELSGGSVTVESQPGQGSRFSVALPLSPRATAVEPSAPEGGPRVLVIDDNPVDRVFFTGLLRRAGYRVEQAEDAIVGLEMARSRVPQVLLVDLRMPRLGGLDAIRLLRADPRMARSRILAVSGLTVPGTREACLAAGAHAYLEKPVNPEELLELVQASSW